MCPLLAIIALSVHRSVDASMRCYIALKSGGEVVLMYGILISPLFKIQFREQFSFEKHQKSKNL